MEVLENKLEISGQRIREYNFAALKDTQVDEEQNGVSSIKQNDAHVFALKTRGS